ncbi:MAG: hypothetical protein EU540_07530 [Promethearchaeota archaeon]|nr:MAG: hypothetical protein EU540_07530 [Candidatus Lokiarchaeota archaeon]
MNITNYVIGFLLLNVLASSSIAHGKENWIAVKNENEFNYKIISFNEELAEEYLDTNDIEEIFGEDAQVGAHCFYKIKSIDYYDDLYPDDENKTMGGWIVDIGRGGWINNNMWRYYPAKPRYETYDSLIILEDPKFLELSFMNIELLIPPYFIPVPVEDYLKSIDWYHEFKVKGKIVTREYEENPGKKLEMIYEFASNGFLFNQKLLTDTNKIIYEYRIENEPIISINMFIILISIFILSILLIYFTYIILKKKRTVIDRLNVSIDLDFFKKYH